MNTFLSRDPICVQRWATWHIMGDPLLRSALHTDPRQGHKYFGSLTLCQIFFIQSDQLKPILQTSGLVRSINTSLFPDEGD